ncbi:MAG: TonB-dependent receptor plug domain-containing protein [Opitutae bacterium]|nr:TonB-dependent receptor plug domain-containing protein [Opitutae bacterium]
MKFMNRCPFYAGMLISAAALLAWPLAASAQEKKTEPAVEEAAAKKDEATKEEIVVLSPFKVTTEKDIGYKVTNATSGTRLNTPIKDLPMPISVISEGFLRDTGSGDLRQSLAYTSGIQLQSQNDQGVPGGAYQGPGGVNNPEGATANKTQSSYKIRGYITDTVLRDGFRRQVSTDSVNISRIEVAFGPAALLYGIGNFGGIVNYIPKAPESKTRSEVGLVAGSYGLYRATLDTTGPISEKWDFNYRLTGALQSSEDSKDFYKESHDFISPSVSFRPFKTTQVDVDYESGSQKKKGVGFQRVRAMANVGVNNDQNEHVDFYTLPGTDPYSFRWSGPDTYVNSSATNLRAQIAQSIGSNLNILVGYNRSTSSFDTRDVQGNLIQNQGPAALRATVNFGNPALNPSVGGSNLNVVSGQVPNVILQYFWNDGRSAVTHEQVRAELNWRFKLFQNSSRWLKMDHSFLLGHSEEKQNTGWSNIKTPDNMWNYKSPLDAGPIRFGKQGDGSADLTMVPKEDGYNIAWDQSTYLVYSGKFLDDRLFVVSGARNDHSDNFVHWNSSVWNTSSDVRSAKAKERTYQNGVSYQITRNISAFALKAEGIQPNFSGAKNTDGNPIGPILAKSTEYGLKFDLFNGKISGSVTKFKINRTGTPVSYWWAPTSNNITFNPAKDIVYNVGNFTPSSAPGGSNGGNGATDAAQAQWNAAVAAGAAYQKNGNWYLNASNATGAAYLDKVFDVTKSLGMSWPGWLYITDSETNQTFGDIAAAKGEVVIATDQADGWGAEIVWSPNRNFQLVASYANVNKIITSAGKFSKYPYPQDRWAVWYFPNTDWGLTGKPLSTVYTDTNDSSTWTGIGYGSGEKQDDTPEHVVTAWGNYQFTTGRAKGLSLGLGYSWESPREYQSGITRGGGQRITDRNGNLVILRTPVRVNVNLMAKYAFKLANRDTSLQFNVTNVLDDRQRYGLIYAAPRAFRLELATRF